MLRLFLTAGLIFLNASALAQPKNIKFGEGCTSPVTKFAGRLGTCTIDGAKSRTWCPNGRVIERQDATPPTSYVVRAMCGLNQILRETGR
jgi:hypothetical protein